MRRLTGKIVRPLRRHIARIEGVLTSAVQVWSGAECRTDLVDGTRLTRTDTRKTWRIVVDGKPNSRFSGMHIWWCNILDFCLDQVERMTR